MRARFRAGHDLALTPEAGTLCRTARVAGPPAVVDMLTDTTSIQRPAPEPASITERPWSSTKRLGFRFVLLYFLLFTHPFPLEYVPDPSRIAQIFGAEWPYAERTDPFYAELAEYQADVARVERRIVDSAAQSIFGFEHTLDRPLGSGDPTYAYVQLAVLLALACLGALLCRSPPPGSIAAVVASASPRRGCTSPRGTGWRSRCSVMASRRSTQVSSRHPRSRASCRPMVTAHR
jgi:hypothetical protein